MYASKKKLVSFALGVTSLLLSRGMLTSFDDEEGANLLVVTGMAVTVYVLAFVLYTYLSPYLKKYTTFSKDAYWLLKKFFIVFIIQMLVTLVLYVCLK